MQLDDSNFKRLFELSGDAMMVLGEQTFLYCNPAALEIYTCPDMATFCQLHPADVSPPCQPCGTPSLQLASQHIKQAMQQGHQRFEWVHQRLNGEEFVSDVLLSQIDWQGQSVLMAIVRDISNYKALQDSLQREKEQSELAANAKSEFLAVMSHEIRTPIHGMLGAQELLLNTDLDMEQFRLASLAMSSSRHLLKIVNDVLDFSKIEAGKLILESTVFDANRLLYDLYAQFELEASTRDITMQLLQDDDNCEVPVKGDAHRIRQILTNLISNAVKFTGPEGNVTLDSRFLPGANDDLCHWHITVSDTGIGITEQQQRLMFAPFAQADSSVSRRYGGTGLGLTISRSLVELLGGEITVQSEFGKGSSFHITLPLRRADSLYKASQEALAATHRDYQQAVLVAEDNPTNQYIIEKKLERLGLQTEVVNNGHSAVEAYLSSVNESGDSHFAAILMDVHMPTLNGIEATRQLREHGCQLPIFALTADVLAERKQECIDAGMQAFIGKPFEESRLIEILDTYLSDIPDRKGLS